MENLGSSFCLRIIAFLAITGILQSRVERSADHGQQLFGFFVGGRGGADADVHAADLIDLVVLDFREDQLFLEAERVIAAAVEGVGVDAAEVADTGQSHVEQTIEELVQSLAAQRDLDADGFAFTDLEVRNGLAGLGGDGLLAGDGSDILADGLDLLGVALGLAAANVDDDLAELRDLHHALVLELAHESGSDFFIVLYMQSRHSSILPLK